MRKRICFILPKFALEEISGAELQVFYLAKELAANNFDVHYIRETSKKTISSKYSDGITLHAIPKIKHFFFQSLNLPYLYARMKEIRADYWYCRVSMSYMAITTLLSSVTGGKVIWACSHDREVSLFTYRTTSKLKKNFERIEHALFIRAIKKADYRLVQTERQQKLLKNNYNLDSYTLQNSHPVPLLKENKRENAIVWVANMRDFKRPRLFLELVKEIADEQVKCVMIGAVTDKELHKEIIVAEKQYPNFQYMGALPVDEVYTIMQRCKILVNTSTEEGFPNTYIQAWMSGIPVVSLGVDPSNIIKTYALGIIVQSVDEMKDAVLQALHNEQQWQDYSTRSREFAIEKFNIKSYVQKFLSIITAED